MVNIFQRYIFVFLSKAKRALFKPFQLRARSLSLSLSLSRRAPAGAKFKSCRGYFNKNRNTVRGRAGSRHGQGWAEPTQIIVLPTQSELDKDR